MNYKSLLVSGVAILTLATAGLACHQPEQQESSLETVESTVEVPKPELLESVVIKEYEGKEYRISNVYFRDVDLDGKNLHVMIANVEGEQFSARVYFAENNEFTITGYEILPDGYGYDLLDGSLVGEDFLQYKDGGVDAFIKFSEEGTVEYDKIPVRDCPWSTTSPISARPAVIDKSCEEILEEVEIAQEKYERNDTLLRYIYNERR